MLFGIGKQRDVSVLRNNASYKTKDRREFLVILSVLFSSMRSFSMFLSIVYGIVLKTWFSSFHAKPYFDIYCLMKNPDDLFP